MVRTYQELTWEILADMGNIGQAVRDFMPGEVLVTSVICRRCQHSGDNNEAM